MTLEIVSRHFFYRLAKSLIYDGQPIEKKCREGGSHSFSLSYPWVLILGLFFIFVVGQGLTQDMKE